MNTPHGVIHNQQKYETKLTTQWMANIIIIGNKYGIVKYVTIYENPCLTNQNALGDVNMSNLTKIYLIGSRPIQGLWVSMIRNFSSNE